MARQPHSRLRFVGYLRLGRVEPGVQRCAATEARARSRRADVLQHDFVAGQRLAGPIGADQVEHAVLDRVPLGSSCGIMSDRDGQSEFIRQVLQAHLPGPTTVPIGASAVGFDRQPRGTWVPVLSNLQPPRTNGSHRKGRRLMGCADHHIARVAIFVVDAVGITAASRQRGKIVVQHVAILTPPSASLVLEVANQLLFLRIHADDRPSLPLESPSPTPQQAELPVTIGVLFPAQPLAVRSQRILLRSQQAGHRYMPDWYAAPRQGSRQVPGCLVRPAQTSHWLTGRCILQQPRQQLPHTRRFFSTRFRPPPGRRTRSEDTACPRSLSRNPRRIVTRLSPVISATCWTPPCPRCLAKIPANSRRLRSSSSAITRLMARWYTTNSVSLRGRHPRQRHRWIRLR